MALLNRKVDYAILVLSHLHQQVEGCCARVIAARFGLSRAFVANILKELCQKGFVTSQRGVKGGYSLDAGAARRTLADLIESLDDTFRLAACNNHDPRAEQCAVFDCCTIKGSVAAVHDRIRNVLRQVTLSELFHPEASPVSLGLPPLARDAVEHPV